MCVRRGSLAIGTWVIYSGRRGGEILIVGMWDMVSSVAVCGFQIQYLFSNTLRSNRHNGHVVETVNIGYEWSEIKLYDMKQRCRLTDFWPLVRLSSRKPLDRQPRQSTNRACLINIPYFGKSPAENTETIDIFLARGPGR